MPVTVIVGGQFGGEGKGKVAYQLAQEQSAHVALRVGGTNSGHTVIDGSGTSVILRQLPTAALLPGVLCVLGAGSYIDPAILLDEVSRTGLGQDRLIIDPNAAIITDKELNEERNSHLRDSIASTLSGTGAAVKKRISRDQSVRLAKHEESLHQFIRPVAPFLRDILSSGKRIIIEGTQGFGLSLLHSQHYPYVTSRDTSASAFVSEAGLSPLDVDEIVLVLRATPIRVGGNSGPLPNEIDWETVTFESRSDSPILEYTSVTKTIRRVAHFDADVVRQAIIVNQPTCIVLNHLDYIDSSCGRLNMLTNKAYSFADKIELIIEQKIDYLGFGPSVLVASLRNAERVRTA
jgi:adenylosuccinate synthase